MPDNFNSTFQSRARYYASGAQGRVFSVSNLVSAPVAIPVSTTTAPTLALWNPLGSGVRVVPLRYTIANVSGNTVAGAVGFQGATGAGGLLNLTAGDVFTRFDFTTPFAAILGGASQPKARANAGGTITLSAAIVNWVATCFNLELDTLATSTDAGRVLSYDFDGLLQLSPGTAIFPVATAATVTLYMQTLYWEEISLAEAS